MTKALYAYDLAQYEWLHSGFMELFRQMLSADDPQAAFDALPLADQQRFSITEFLTQTANGGLDQYFYNSSGDECGILANLLAEIRASRALECLTACMALFPDGKPSSDCLERREQLAVINRDRKKIDDVVAYDVEPDLCERFRSYYDERKRSRTTTAEQGDGDQTPPAVVD